MINYRLKALENVYNSLQDEKSRKTFHARFDYIITGDENKFYNWFMEENDTLYCPELDEYENKWGKCEYILFGCGEEGIKTKQILEKCSKKINAWCDNNEKMWGKEKENIAVLSPSKLIDYFKEEIVIITPRNPNSAMEIYKQLLKLGIPREKIIIPRDGCVRGFCGNEYFDVFEAEPNEIFIDDGCLNGETSREFAEWCNWNYEKIYAFEPEEAKWNICETFFQKESLENVEFIKKGTWDRSDTVSFSSSGFGCSKVDENGNTEIEVVSIDDVMEGNKVSFIKMDIEGSELKSLKGAKNVIQKYHPKMAICVYHRPEDLWEIGDFVLGLNPKYKLYLRHYNTSPTTTILYAMAI